MAETKWTPGPWYLKPSPVDAGRPEYEVCADDPSMPPKIYAALLTTYTRDILADTWFDGRPNAILAAAAPELYRLLDAWLTAHAHGKVQFVPQFTGDAAALNQLWRDTCTTLLNARGESVQSPGDHQESNPGPQGGQNNG